MEQTLPFRTEGILLARFEAVGLGYEQTQLGQPLGHTVGVTRDVVSSSPQRHERPPRNARLRPPRDLLWPTERVQCLELIAGSRKPALLELTGHRKKPLRCGCEILACHCTPPGIRPRTAVREDPPREHDPGFARWAQFLDHRQFVLVGQRRRNVELRLDICLVPSRPDRGHVAARAKQQADRLGEDRLTGARLTREDIQPRHELQLRLADQDEVLDAQPTKQSSACSGARTSPPARSRATNGRRRAGL